MQRHVLLRCGIGLALLCAVRLAAAAPAIALVEGEGTLPNSFVTDVQNKLIATALFSTVDVIDGTSVTPSVAQLQAYRAILVWSDSNFLDSNALGNNVDTYIRSGGGVVVAVFANTDPGSLDLRGAWATNLDSPMTVADQTEGTELTLGTIHVPGSPLLSGVSSFDGGTSSYYDPGVLTPGAVDVADWSNGTPLVATKQVGNFQVVMLNFFPPSSDARSDFWNSSTNGVRLMTNALLNAGGPAAAQAGVPSLSEGSLALLVALVLGAGIWRLRRA